MAEFTASPLDAMPTPHAVWAMRDVVLEHLAKRGHSRSRERRYNDSVLLLLLCFKFNPWLILAFDLVDRIDMNRL